VVLAVELTADHVCASAAIPIVFPPVRIRSAAGDLYFGDGGLRLVTPFSPAIRLGATHVLAIGIRSQRAADALSREELNAAEESGTPGPYTVCPPLAQICGVFMNAIFLDHLDSDLDHLQRMNEVLLAHARPVSAGGPAPSEPMRHVTPLVVSPSEDLAMVAQRFAHRMPRLVRYLMEGLGTPDAQSADLMSYLLFDAAYTRALIDIGYRDASERIDEIEAFLRAGQAGGSVAARREAVPAGVTALPRSRPERVAADERLGG
jgi:NTE family protein